MKGQVGAIIAGVSKEGQLNQFLNLVTLGQCLRLCESQLPPPSSEEGPAYLNGLLRDDAWESTYYNSWHEILSKNNHRF